MKNTFTLFILIIIYSGCREIGQLSPNSSPIAVAGEDIILESGNIVYLDATTSFDNDNDPLFFNWIMHSKPPGSAAYIEDIDSAKTHFVADIDGTYIVKLLVSDGISSAIDSVKITAQYKPKLKVSTLVNINSPIFGTLGPDGNLYVSSYNGHVIYKITGSGVISIFAGTGIAGYLDGKSANAQFKNPAGLVFDAAGTLYVCDNGNHCIRAVNTSSVVSTFAGFPQAGYLDATGGQAQFNGPSSIVMDSKGSFFVSETGNLRIRKITSKAVVTTFAGSGKPGIADTTGVLASFKSPVNMAIDANDNLYIADATNYRIRRITPLAIVKTIAGTDTSGYVDGVALKSRFVLPYGVATSASGSVFVSDFSDYRIRVISNGQVSTYAGSGVPGILNGLALASTFSNPTGVVYDNAKSLLYVMDYGNNAIRVIKYE